MSSESPSLFSRNWWDANGSLMPQDKNYVPPAPWPGIFQVGPPDPSFSFGWQIKNYPPQGQTRELSPSELAPMPAYAKENMPFKPTIGLSSMDAWERMTEGDIAHVHGTGPIHVKIPGMVDKSVLAHELEHVYAGSRNWGFPRPEETKHATYSAGDKVGQSAPSEYYSPTDAYWYGGVPGLEAARRDGLTVTDFGKEAQAQIFGDYLIWGLHFQMLADKGMMTPAWSQAYERVQKAYGPFMRQLLGIPAHKQDSYDDDIDYSKEAPPKPPTPGLPDPYTTGIYQPMTGLAGTPVKLKK